MQGRGVDDAGRLINATMTGTVTIASTNPRVGGTFGRRRPACDRAPGGSCCRSVAIRRIESPERLAQIANTRRPRKNEPKPSKSATSPV